MGILVTIIIGFIIGIVARFLKPGPDNLGFIMTTLLGIGGALLGSYLGQGFGWYAVGEPAGFIVSVISAMLLLFLFQALAGKRGRAL